MPPFAEPDRLRLAKPATLAIEHAADIVPTANEVTNAVRACSRLNDEARWIDPPKRHIVVHVDEHANPFPESRAQSVETPAAKPANFDSQPKTREVTNVTAASVGPNSMQVQSPTWRLEHDATR
jgi:hypothetical protein